MSSRFRDSDDPLWLADSRRNLIRGALLLTLLPIFVASLWLPWLFIMLWGSAAVLLARSVRNCAWKTPDLATRISYAIHSHFQQIPILFGQVSWHWDRIKGQRRLLIEYK